MFCLLGTFSDVSSWGEKCSPKVHLVIKELNLDIVRTKKPNRLVVNGVYEDDVGQEIINQRIGDAFEIMGYIPQNPQKAFALMKASDKLVCLENFLNKETNISDMKARCKSLIQQYRDEHLKAQTCLENANKLLAELEEPEEISFPFKTNDEEKRINNENIKLNNANITIKKLTRLLSSLEKKIHEIQVFELEIRNKDENILEKQTNLHLLTEKYDDIDYIGDDMLLIIQNQLKTFISQKEYNHALSTYETELIKLTELKDGEINEWKQHLDNFESIWEEYSQEDVLSSISEYKQMLEDARTISLLEKRIKKIKSTVDCEQVKEEINQLTEELNGIKVQYDGIKQINKKFNCPSCAVPVFFKDERLEIVSAEYNEQIDNGISAKDLKNRIDKIQSIIEQKKKQLIIDENNMKMRTECQDDIDEITIKYKQRDENLLEEKEIKENLSYFEAYLSQEQKKEVDKSEYERKMKNKEYSKPCRILEQNLAKQEQKIAKLKANLNEKVANIDLDETILRSQIQSEENKQNQLFHLGNDITKLQKSIDKIQKEKQAMIDEYTAKYQTCSTKEEILGEIENTKNGLKEKENEKIKLEKNIELIGRYLNNKKEREIYNKRLNQQIECVRIEEHCRRKYTSATKLKEKIADAEAVSLMSIVDRINAQVQTYLEAFFPDSPMIAMLSCFKETKKNNKAQINLEINYKNTDCNLNDLSGGELSRVNLAFTLALNEIFNCPILLLDEVTTSLDEFTTTIIFDYLKEHLKNKLVIVIAHQITEGVFDRVIKFE